MWMKSSADEIQELVIKAKNNDMEAFSSLYSDIYIDLYKCALSIVKKTYSAEDIVSETVVAAFRSIKSLRDNSSFKSWIYVILVNKCKKYLMDYKNQFTSIDERQDISSDEGISIEDRLEIRKTYEELDDEERTIISLSVFAGFNSKEISKIVHKRPGSIRSIKSRGLEKMKIKLERKGIYEGY